MDNLIHGDLHPGNILVLTDPEICVDLESVNRGDSTKHLHVHTSSHSDGTYYNSTQNIPDSHTDSTDMKRLPRSIFQDVSNCESPNHIYLQEMVFLDAGLTITLSDRDKKNFVDLFKAVAKGEGEKAGRLMLERSSYVCRDNDHDGHDGHDHISTEGHSDTRTPVYPPGVRDPEGFILGMKDIVESVNLESFRLDKVGIGSTLEQVMNLVYKHQIKVESGFTSLVLSMIVLEGVGRQLDPTIDIFKESIPIIHRASPDYKWPAIRVVMDIVYKRWFEAGRG